MRLTMKSLTGNSPDLQQVSNLLYETFPKIERLPLDLLLYRSNFEGIDLLAIYDEGIFIGFTYVVTYKKLMYVQYLAVDSRFRSKGYGGAILSRIKEEYGDYQIVLNIEVVDANIGNYGQRVTRKKFYVRNGYASSGLFFRDRFDVYEVMVHGDKEVDPAELTDLMRTFYGTSLFMYLEIQISRS